jgi:hypothetical protein
MIRFANVSIIEDVKTKLVPSLYMVLKEVSDITGISIDALKSKSRQADISVARQIYFKRAKMQTKQSLARIGLIVNRDHATALHGIKQVEEVYELGNLYCDYFGGKRLQREPKIKLVQSVKEPIKEPVKPKEMPVQRTWIDKSSMKIGSMGGYSGYREHSI